MNHSKKIYDMHCHLGFMRDDISTVANSSDTFFFSMTVDPNTFSKESKRFSGIANVKVGAGLHPRWISQGICDEHDVQLLIELIENHTLIGEIGLDYLPQYLASKHAQHKAFDQIAQKCAYEKGKVLSIHALKSNDDVLDIIEKHKLTDSCICVMHWFNGSNDQLLRAINQGCYFSINNRFMKTKRGPHYVSQIPTERLLLESDLPSSMEDPTTIETLRDSLLEAQALIETATMKCASDEIMRNSQRIFNLC